MITPKEIGHRLRKQAYAIIGDNDTHSWFDYIILITVLINTVTMMLETVPEYKSYNYLFGIIEHLCVMVFMIEYGLRVWCIVEDPKHKHWFWGRFKFVTSFMGLIDLSSFLFFYIRIFGVEVRFLRLISLLRIIKTTRYFNSFKLIFEVFYIRGKELILSFFLVCFIIVISSIIIYHLEYPAQPDKFTSIPACIWWCIVTITSVGYGDMAPITSMGRTFGSILAVIGVCTFALPVAILSSGFTELYKEINKERKKKDIPKPLFHNNLIEQYTNKK